MVIVTSLSARSGSEPWGPGSSREESIPSHRGGVVVPRSRNAAAGLIVASAMAACQGGNSLATIGALAGSPGATQAPSNVTTPAGTGSAPVAQGGPLAVQPAEGITFPVAVTNFPASTPVPTPAPTPPPEIVRVEISPDSLVLNTPRDTSANPAWPDAGFPWKVQLVGIVRYSNGTYTTDVNWTSENPALVSVDASGWVWSTSPRNTGTTKVWAIARGASNHRANIPVTVADFGKVLADVH